MTMRSKQERLFSKGRDKLNEEIDIVRFFTEFRKAQKVLNFKIKLSYD